jgi:hypothetical protein
MRARTTLQAVRLAAPLQGAATLSLADREIAGDLQAVIALTAGTGGVRAYVERPFLYPAPSRFSDGSFGVFYCADSLAAAVREVAHHLSQTFAAAQTPALETRRVRLSCSVRGVVEDIRHSVEPSIDERLYDPGSYEWSQPFGAALRGQNALGIYYDSVRYDAAACAAVFDPQIVKRIAVDGEIALRWDGTRFYESALIESL